MPADAGRALLGRVGRRVAEVRSEAGLTQETLAERLEVALTYVARIEQGRQNVTLRSLARVAEALGVDPRVLLDAPTSPPPRRGRPRRPPETRPA